MFTTDCPGHGATVLIWPSNIDAVRNTDAGIELHFHCTCGHRGVWVTGRAQGKRDEPTATPSRVA